MLLHCKRVAIAQRLAPFSTEVAEGELIHLLGPNGAGKSTLLAALAGMLNAAGEIRLLGEPLGSWSGYALARRRAWLSQQQQAPGAMPLWHYLQMHQIAPSTQSEIALATLCERFQLNDKLTRPLSQLSGGEWQRVRLTAVFSQIAQPEGKLMILDEPLTGLDLAQQAAFDSYLAERVKEGLTVIMSGHDLNHSLHHATRVWLMKAGALVDEGAADSVLRPENLNVVYEVPFRRLCVEGRVILTTWV